MADESEPLAVTVACALPARQSVVNIDVPAGTTARQAVVRAGLQPQFPELDLASAPLAIYGRPVADGQVLQAGDRVEILRSLHVDPRTARREAAARGLTLGRSGDDGDG